MDLIQTDQNAAQVLAWSVLSKGMVSWPGPFCLPGSGGAAKHLQLPRYALRLLITALVSEVPYDLAMSASGWTGPVRTFCSPCSSAWWPCTWSRRWRSPENGRALQVLFPVGAVLWTFLFQTQLGILVVLAMTAMYFLRERPLWRDIRWPSWALPPSRLPQRPADPLPPPGPSMFPQVDLLRRLPHPAPGHRPLGYFLL